MAQRQMYFGTRGEMAWIPCPRSGAPMNMNRYVSENQWDRGSSTLYQSVAGSKVYEFDFGFKHQADIQHLLNIDAGMYYDSDDYVYFVEPFAAKSNCLPLHWSVPFLAAYGTPNLMGKTWHTQAVTPTQDNTYKYPTRSAVLGNNPTWNPDNALELWIPVPQGYTFHFGAHSHDESNTTPYVGITPDGDTEDVVTLLPNDTATLTNYTYTPVSNSGVTLKLNGDEDESLIISGMIAQILPVGKPAPTGTFIAGEGHSGCRIVGGIQREGYSAALDWQQFSGTFKEYGNWDIP